MVQFQVIEGKKYIVLTEEDFQNIKEIEIGGKKKYIIPQKHSMKEKFDKDEVYDMLGKLKIDEIAKYYGKSVSWLKNKLYVVWGTSCVSKILAN